MDVKTTFLNGQLNKKIYMEKFELGLPQEQINFKFVCKLEKALCGLEQSLVNGTNI
jgi:hypothetical protein